MSYSIYAEEVEDGLGNLTSPFNWNYTSNCADMWREAGADLGEFDGKVASECVPVLSKAITELAMHAPKYRLMNPINGWGSYDSLMPALCDLLSKLVANPGVKVRVHR